MPSDGSSWRAALANVAKKPRVKIGGHEFVFTASAPAMLADVERQCLEWGRKRLAAAAEAIPGWDQPGTAGAAAAAALFAEWGRQVSEEAYCPPAGSEYQKFMATIEGRVSMLVASLSPDQPGITAADVMAMFAAAPAEMRAVVVELGNEVRSLVEAVGPAADAPAG